MKAKLGNREGLGEAAKDRDNDDEEREQVSEKGKMSTQAFPVMSYFRPIAAGMWVAITEVTCRANNTYRSATRDSGPPRLTLESGFKLNRSEEGMSLQAKALRLYTKIPSDHPRQLVTQESG